MHWEYYDRFSGRAVEVCAHDVHLFLLDNKRIAAAGCRGCYPGEVTRCYYEKLLLKFHTHRSILLHLLPILHRLLVN